VEVSQPPAEWHLCEDLTSDRGGGRGRGRGGRGRGRGGRRGRVEKFPVT